MVDRKDKRIARANIVLSLAVLPMLSGGDILGQLKRRGMPVVDRTLRRHLSDLKSRGVIISGRPSSKRKVEKKAGFSLAPDPWFPEDKMTTFELKSGSYSGFNVSRDFLVVWESRELPLIRDFMLTKWYKSASFTSIGRLVFAQSSMMTDKSRALKDEDLNVKKNELAEQMRERALQAYESAIEKNLVRDQAKPLVDFSTDDYKMIYDNPLLRTQILTNLTWTFPNCAHVYFETLTRNENMIAKLHNRWPFMTDSEKRDFFLTNQQAFDTLGLNMFLRMVEVANLGDAINSKEFLPVFLLSF